MFACVSLLCTSIPKCSFGLILSNGLLLCCLQLFIFFARSLPLSSPLYLNISVYWIVEFHVVARDLYFVSLFCLSLLCLLQVSYGFLPSARSLFVFLSFRLCRLHRYFFNFNQRIGKMLTCARRLLFFCNILHGYIHERERERERRRWPYLRVMCLWWCAAVAPQMLSIKTSKPSKQHKIIYI